MKKIILTIIAAMGVCSCKDNLHLVFSDYFVCIKDEYGMSSSDVNTEIEGVYTYYVNLVSPTRTEKLSVDYEIISGEGLENGVDYIIVSQSRQVVFAPGITSMPIRIDFRQKRVDENKDNTITIRLKSTSDSSVRIGYPGPEAKFSEYKIKKVNL